MLIATFCPVNCSTISYGDSFFDTIEVCHIFFWFYYMWRGTGICDKCFSVILLVWCFSINSSSYIICSVIFFADCFSAFYSCSNHFLHCCSFFNDFIFSCYICSCFSYLFLIWFSSRSLSWHLWFCLSNDFLERFQLLCASFFSVVSVFPTSRAGTLVLVFYCSFIRSNFAKRLSQIFSVVIGLFIVYFVL